MNDDTFCHGMHNCMCDDRICSIRHCRMDDNTFFHACITILMKISFVMVCITV